MISQSLHTKGWYIIAIHYTNQTTGLLHWSCEATSDGDGWSVMVEIPTS